MITGSVCVVGGCGHVGLPLALAFAKAGVPSVSYDINVSTVDNVNNGKMPFDEPGGDEVLRGVLEKGLFSASSDPQSVSSAEFVVVVIGTPVDEHLNPHTQAVPDAVESLIPFLSAGQVLILRSTVYPGTTKLVEKRLAEAGCTVPVTFCPERIAEGKAFEELYSLPQIVSGRSAEAADRASNLFSMLTDEIVRTSPEEAELAKLFTNTWRYIKFAAANQFFMIANEHGIDFENIRHAITHNYPRAIDMPGAGFAAGPCLFKDTMQLAAFNNNNFFLGHASMMVNEGLPLYLVERMDRRFNLLDKKIGILGMAFKAESDDIRSSLSYKLKRILKFRSAGVLCHDPYVSTDSDLVDLETVIAESDILVVGTPHSMYRNLQIDKPVVDVWNALGNGVVI
jgi:UDP-N-acetyl-D-mannosaminuronic acid dehydrogenase